jgi:hypothetical protein
MHRAKSCGERPAEAASEITGNKVKRETSSEQTNTNKRKRMLCFRNRCRNWLHFRPHPDSQNSETTVSATFLPDQRLDHYFLRVPGLLSASLIRSTLIADETVHTISCPDLIFSKDWTRRNASYLIPRMRSLVFADVIIAS